MTCILHNLLLFRRTLVPKKKKKPKPICAITTPELGTVEAAADLSNPLVHLQAQCAWRERERDRTSSMKTPVLSTHFQ